MLQDNQESEHNERGVDHESSPFGGLEPTPRSWIVRDFVFPDLEVRDADGAKHKAEKHQDATDDLDVVQR